MTGSAGIAGPTLWPEGQSGLLGEGNRECAGHTELWLPSFLPSLAPACVPFTYRLTEHGALCQAPSPSFTRAYNLAEETNTQQIITMHGVECDSGDRHSAVRAQVGGLELNPLSQGEFLEE